jgi:hypothetical protein
VGRRRGGMDLRWDDYLDGGRGELVLLLQIVNSVIRVVPWKCL